MKTVQSLVFVALVSMLTGCGGTDSSVEPKEEVVNGVSVSGSIEDEGESTADTQEQEETVQNSNSDLNEEESSSVSTLDEEENEPTDENADSSLSEIEESLEESEHNESNGVEEADENSDSAQSEPSLLETYPYEVINNAGESVRGTLGEYTVKLYAKTNENTNPFDPHKAVVVKLDETSSTTMFIQEGYQGKSIVAVVYDANETVNQSNEVTVTDAPVVVVTLDNERDTL